MKCLNIFMGANDQIKLGDMGVSEFLTFGHTQHGKRVGTPLYLSPEIVKNYQYDHKVDIWAIGCSLYYLASLENPF
jgi:NIMA (never in mitosis gene a)-related kinase